MASSVMKEHNRDQVFAAADGAEAALEGFAFSARVARVFDDMVTRSVPAYGMLQALVAELTLRLSGGGTILDLGCSTGNTFLAIEELSRATGERLHYVGVDASAPMLAECQQKLQRFTDQHTIELEHLDFTGRRSLGANNVRVALCVLVLQFIRPLERQRLLRKIYRSLADGGHLIVVEKVMQQDRQHNALFIDWYHDYKRSVGYSNTEIALKRQALENRLIPFFASENVQLLQSAGFGAVSSFFQAMNFQGFLARKGGADE